MKLRIVQDRAGCGKRDWFKLEKLVDGQWRYVSGSIEIKDLENFAAVLLSTGTEFTIIKEFSNEPESNAAEPQSLVAIDHVSV
jgi:hypothetical protein